MVGLAHYSNWQVVEQQALLKLAKACSEVLRRMQYEGMQAEFMPPPATKTPLTLFTELLLTVAKTKQR